MNIRERFQTVFNHQKPDDRLPMIEWATWWDLTLDRWHQEGLDPSLEGDDLFKALNLDPHHQYWLTGRGENCPEPDHYGAALIEDEEDYERLKPNLYSMTRYKPFIEEMRRLEERHRAGDFALWYTLDGGFWFPRLLFGIEGHLYSFYDYADLYHRILDDLADYYLKLLEEVYAVCMPDFMTFAEDMSYNKGPMLSKQMFDEFLVPFYRRLIPFIHAHGTKVIVDSDGDITEMVPWLERAGLDGALPLEYQAGVDVNRLHEEHPNFLILGGFNKLIMKDGEAAMRAEFERILPVMRSGGYIPSVDHQTPPDVPLENYKIYIRLFEEYTRKAVRES